MQAIWDLEQGKYALGMFNSSFESLSLSQSESQSQSLSWFLHCLILSFPCAVVYGRADFSFAHTDSHIFSGSFKKD